MSDLFWLTDAQMERSKPFFPVSHGGPRVDDRRVLRGIVFISCHGCIAAWRGWTRDRSDGGRKSNAGSRDRTNASGAGILATGVGGIGAPCPPDGPG